MEPSLRRS